MRRLAATIAGASICFAAAGAVVSAQTAPRTAITVTSTTPSDTLPFFYAVQKGMFERAGLDVTVVPSPSGSSSIVAVVGGAAQFGYANTLSLSAAHLKGIPVQLVAPGGEYNSAAPYAKLLVAADSPVRTAKDLEGKIVAVTGLHDLLAVSTIAWIDKNGGDPAKVKFVEVPPAAMVAAMQQKRVDAVAFFEPYVSAAEAGGARPIGRPYDAVASRFMTAAWFGNGNWIKEHHDAALRFAQVINQAQEYTNAHYDELVPFIAEYSKLPVETLRKMPVVRVPATLSGSSIQPLIDLATKYKELATNFRAQDMILPGVP
jgi:NitT/TauT family transport system substrate-binding protein